MPKHKTTDAVAILDQMIRHDQPMKEMIEEATINAKVAQMIYKARKQAGLTQAQLADKIGTSQPVIARLEDADYEGHSLSMLVKIGEALGKRLSLDWAAAEAH
jgi:ribosome-binding protein aMBF1 (putative translation factor)